MRYLFLNYLNEKEMAALPEDETNDLNARHLELNEGLRKSGNFVEAEALEPLASASCVRVRRGKATVTDGPFAEAKEQVAGFYLVEAADMGEAVRIASRIPSAPLGTVEIRPVRQLVVEERPGR